VSDIGHADFRGVFVQPGDTVFGGNVEGTSDRFDLRVTLDIILAIDDA
jgi:hypothetical protein